jgi:large subunit ribosomal protein L13
MKTIFPKKESHIPKWFVVDAANKKVGRLATEVSKLLRGKENSFFTPGVDQGNYVVILNADKIEISGNKAEDKLYYRNNQRPGSLKIETFKDLKSRIPSRIVEKAVWGMLPKGVLGREYYRRLFIYSGNEINYKKNKNGEAKTIPLELAEANNWIKVEI